MTGGEADAILGRIARGEMELERTRHCTEELVGHGYTLQDIRPLIRTGAREAAPEWTQEHREYRVRILGRSLDGRPTRLVLGLRTSGPQTLVTIMPVRGNRLR